MWIEVFGLMGLGMAGGATRTRTAVPRAPASDIRFCSLPNTCGTRSQNWVPGHACMSVFMFEYVRGFFLYSAAVNFGQVVFRMDLLVIKKHMNDYQ